MDMLMAIMTKTAIPGDLRELLVSDGKLLLTADPTRRLFEQRRVCMASA